uniref:Ig-like domain-containing protein n=1 Tax=Seriola lalandi dorsalis TaxID=1841481 RepID=A0A3B4WDE8_SERLL
MNVNYVLKHLHHVITEISVSLGVSCEKLTPVKTEEFSSEGSTVTLSYNYSTKATGNDYFFWYRQYPGKPPEFLIFHFGTQNETKSGLSVTVSGDKTRMDLQISSAAVTDSALYYCAVKPTVTANPQSLYKNTS